MNNVSQHFNIHYAHHYEQDYRLNINKITQNHETNMISTTSGTRTRTTFFWSIDFKSIMSTNSIIVAITIFMIVLTILYKMAFRMALYRVKKTEEICLLENQF